MPSTPYLVCLCSSECFRLRFRSLLLAAFLAWSVVASASGSKEALSHGHAGLSAYDAGRWESALSEFVVADSMMHSPVFSLYIARCQRKLGHWLEARRQYRAVAMTPILPETPGPWRHAVEVARSELQALQAELPGVKLLVVAPPDQALRLRLDGVEVESSGWNTLVELDPGDHVASLERAETKLSTANFSLEPGERDAVVTLTAPSEAEPLSPAPAAPTVKPRATPGEQLGRGTVSDTARTRTSAVRAYRTAGASALIVGTVSVLVGAVCAGWAWQERNALHHDCGGYDCPSSEQARWRRATRAADLATISLSVGAVNLAVGGYLYYIAPLTLTTVDRRGARLSGWSLGVGRSF